MSNNQAKIWKCSPQGHALGVVARNGSGVRQLMFYRQAVDMEGKDGLPPAEVEVMGTAEGLVMDIVCSICGRVRTWVPGEEAMRRILERVRKQELIEE